MNWLETIDGYCERIDASFWSEPLNAVTNVIFLLTAIWVLRRDRLNNKARALAFILGLVLPLFFFILLLLHGLERWMYYSSYYLPFYIFLLLQKIFWAYQDAAR